MYFSSNRSLYIVNDNIDLSSASYPVANLGEWLDLLEFKNGIFGVDAIQFRSAVDTDGVYKPLISTNPASTATLALRLVDNQNVQQVNILSPLNITGSATTIPLTEIDTSRYIEPGSRIQVKIENFALIADSEIFIRILFSSRDANPRIEKVLGV